MNEQKTFEDEFYQHFGPGEYHKLLAAQKQFEDATHWEEDIPTRQMQFTGFDCGPAGIDTAMSDPACSGISQEVLADTLKNSGLIVHYNGQNVCLRSCAMQSLTATIGISGPALGRADKVDLAGGLNCFIKSARDKSKVMIRANKISAVLSKNYKYMPISKLLAVCGDLERSFGFADFVNGSIAHNLTTAEFEFPESAAKITEAYNAALEDAGRSRSGTLIPVVQLRAADTCDEAAKMMTYLKFAPGKMMPIGGFSVKHINPRSTRKDGNRDTCMDKFRKEASLLFAKLEYDVQDLIPKMLEVRINYPGNAFIGLCKYAGIPQKWGGQIEEKIRSDFPDGSECCFLDLYEYMTEVTGCAIRDGYMPSSSRVLTLEEGIAKVARHREYWKRYDLPGTVAWSQTASSQE